MPTAVAAFKAARKVPWGAKAVWVEDWILDRGPEASWISATHLAARLGMSKENVEQHRRHLLSLGFYHVVRRIGAKSDGWVPTLPLGCRHHGTTVEAIQETAQRIDALVTGSVRPIENGIGRSAPSGVAPPARRGVAGSASSGVVDSAMPRPLIQNLSEGQPLTPSQDRTRVGARAPKAEKEAVQEPLSESEEKNWEPITRPADQRPADDVTNDGMGEIRRKIQFREAAEAERRRKSGTA